MSESPCPRCGYIAPPPPTNGLGETEAGRLVSLASWLDQHVAERAGDIDPMMAAGFAAIMRKAQRDPVGTWATIANVGDVLDAIRGWVRDGTPPAEGVFDRVLTGSGIVAANG